jgi:hypothetical protein
VSILHDNFTLYSPDVQWQLKQWLLLRISLKPLDVEFMRRLHTKVNLIPVIAKSDTLTEDEIKQFKQRILEDIAFHTIQIYQAPQYEYDDPETIAENREIIVSHSFTYNHINDAILLRHACFVCVVQNPICGCWQ